MAQITGGLVEYSRTVKVSDFEPKKATAQLTFAVGEGEDHQVIFDTASRLALSRVNQILGIGGKAEDASFAQPETPAAGAATKPPKGSKKAEAKSTEKLAISTGGERNDPAAVDVEDVVSAGEAQPSTSTKSAASQPSSGGTSNDPAAVEDWEKPAEITDVALTSALTQKNASLNNPVKIRELIGKYVGAGKQAKEIPQDKRAQFLEDLKALA